MDGPEEDSSSPIPVPKGSYNFSFDDFDENTNPFQSKSKISNSPPKNDTLVSPFATKCKLGSSPVENNNVINKEVDACPDPVTETPSSRGIKKPRSPDESSTNGPENDDHQTSVVMDTADTSPETEQVKEPPKTKKTTGAKTAVKKGIKKPKKFKPPANFGFQGGNDGDDIQIFAPQSQQTSSFPENSEVSTSNAPVNDVTSDDHRTQTNKENDFLESHDVQSSNHMTQSLEMVHDFGAGEMPKGMLFHQDNASVYKSVIAMAAIHNCGFNLIEHPPCSPDLAPSDFHLFPKLKTATFVTHFQSDDDVIHAVDDFLNSQEKEFFKSGIEVLKHCWQKCIETEGDYA